ncbi:MAG: hypothetical protein II493_03680 [Spirochaetales bacterium]|nr:hypothetical protein [Spirochaetales bacterium]
MRKLLSLMLIVLIGALLVVSCNDSPTPTPPSPSDPTYTPTLTSYNVKEVFAQGITENDARSQGFFGSLKYMDAKGNVSTVSVKESSDVTIKGFLTDTATGEDEVRTLVFQYKGLSATAKYKVYKLEIPAVKGTFVIGKNTTLTLDTVKSPYSATITTYDNYMCLYNYAYGGVKTGVVEKQVTVSYGFIADTSNVKIIVDGSYYRPDGTGGLEHYVQDVDVLEPLAGHEYVSTEKFDNRSITQEVVRGKWLGFKFVDMAGLPMEKDDYVWNFYLLEHSYSEFPTQPTFQITADKISFDVSGVYVDKKTDLELPDYARNFQAGPSRDSSYTEFKGLHVVSYADNTWNGYSCTLVLRNDPT